MGLTATIPNYSFDTHAYDAYHRMALAAPAMALAAKQLIDQLQRAQLMTGWHEGQCDLWLTPYIFNATQSLADAVRAAIGNPA